MHFQLLQHQLPPMHCAATQSYNGVRGCATPLTPSLPAFILSQAHHTNKNEPTNNLSSFKQSLSEYFSSRHSIDSLGSFSSLAIVQQHAPNIEREILWQCASDCPSPIVDARMAECVVKGP